MNHPLREKGWKILFIKDTEVQGKALLCDARLCVGTSVCMLACVCTRSLIYTRVRV